jgi:predicted nucleic acid-binding protein
MEGCKIHPFIPDASVVVKWFIDEEFSDTARGVRAQYVKGKLDLIAPKLLEYEVTNALRFHPVVKLSRKDIFSVISTLRNLDVMIDPSETMWIRAIELSLSEGVSVYDAVYLAVAESSEGKTLSSDIVLKNKLSGKIKDSLVLLKELDMTGLA